MSLQLATLPSDIHVELANYLPVRDTVQLAQTCAALRAVYHALAWRAVYVDDRVPPPRSPMAAVIPEPFRFAHMLGVPWYVVGTRPAHYAWFFGAAVARLVLPTRGVDGNGAAGSVRRFVDEPAQRALMPALRVVTNYNHLRFVRTSCAVVYEEVPGAIPGAHPVQLYEALGPREFLNRGVRLTVPAATLRYLKLELDGADWSATTSILEALAGAFANGVLRVVDYELCCERSDTQSYTAQLLDYLAQLAVQCPVFRPHEFRLAVENGRPRDVEDPNAPRGVVPFVTDVRLVGGTLDALNLPVDLPSVRVLSIDGVTALPLGPLRIPFAATLTTLYLRMDASEVHAGALPIRALPALRRLAVTVSNADAAGELPEYAAPFVTGDPDAAALQDLQAAIVAAEQTLGRDSAEYLALACFARALELPQRPCEPLEFGDVQGAAARRLRLEELFAGVYEAARAPRVLEHLRVELRGGSGNAPFAPFWLHRLTARPGTLRQALIGLAGAPSAVLPRQAEVCVREGADGSVGLYEFGGAVRPWGGAEAEEEWGQQEGGVFRDDEFGEEFSGW